MKILVVYDSVYGNTEKIAKSISDTITGEARLLRFGEVNPSELKTMDLFIVGSPTQGGRPTPAIREFLSKVPTPYLKGINVAAFDTRFSSKWVKIFGYAAGKIARNLERLRSILIVPPEGFFVESTKGPLKEGELQRAASWAKGIVKSKKQFNNETSVAEK